MLEERGIVVGAKFYAHRFIVAHQFFLTPKVNISAPANELPTNRPSMILPVGTAVRYVMECTRPSAALSDGARCIGHS